jgi:hypothetical protein
MKTKERMLNIIILARKITKINQLAIKSSSDAREEMSLIRLLVSEIVDNQEELKKLVD